MKGRSIGRRGATKVAFALLVVGTATAGFAVSAGADSSVSTVTAGACAGGTNERDVTVSYSTNAAFTTGVRFLVVSGAPDGPTVETVTLDLPGPASTTVTFQLPAGTYYFDWEDRAGDGVTWSGRHSELGDFYRGIYLATATVVAPCAVVDEPTTTTLSPPTIPATGPTVPQTATPGIATTGPSNVPAPTPPTTTIVAQTIPATGPTIPPTAATIPPTGPTVPSTAPRVTTPNPPSPPVTATAPVTATIPPLGGNTAPMLAVGAGFLGLGVVGLLAARRPSTRRN